MIPGGMASTNWDGHTAALMKLSARLLLLCQVKTTATDGFDSEYIKLRMVRLTHIFVSQRNLEAIALGCGTSSILEDISGMILMSLGFLFTIKLCSSSSGQLVTRLHVHIYQSISDIPTEKTITQVP